MKIHARTWIVVDPSPFAPPSPYGFVSAIEPSDPSLRAICFAHVSARFSGQSLLFPQFTVYAMAGICSENIPLVQYEIYTRRVLEYMNVKLVSVDSSWTSYWQPSLINIYFETYILFLTLPKAFGKTLLQKCRNQFNRIFSTIIKKYETTW